MADWQRLDPGTVDWETIEGGQVKRLAEELTLVQLAASADIRSQPVGTLILVREGALSIEGQHLQSGDLFWIPHDDIAAISS